MRLLPGVASTVLAFPQHGAVATVPHEAGGLPGRSPRVQLPGSNPSHSLRSVHVSVELFALRVHDVQPGRFRQAWQHAEAFREGNTSIRPLDGSPPQHSPTVTSPHVGSVESPPPVTQALCATAASTAAHTAPAMLRCLPSEIYAVG